MVHKDSRRWLAVLLISVMPLAAQAQAEFASAPAQEKPDTAATAASSSKADSKAQKQALKAQRQAERKQARQIRNAELKNLQRNGYGPQAAPDQYPENLLNAERKSAPQKAVPLSPASSN
ncbi:conserved exported hypothetical protein [Paraburkholderia piptadeniae]|uniref:DUF4148 domain-containing protein n=1 Tax=Paraburkholderia piptadeniae TaxID=1701573 RepID=A0A1N7RS01_9BURK|nr:hypothetical protein [Paraburkholderia piptadeniae]SIT37873.1 conserved exported hypothetical protein [Paraburkholderia piptadeniae]